ncbi:MAG TPA: transglycosylase domain-containing protein [Mycobacteriales bacterium]|nr:transglycosylase domain-containing protein [Mycobacteriales bacterium]
MRRRLRLAVAGAALAVTATGCIRAIPVDPSVLGGQAVTSTVYAADGSVLTTLHAEEDRRPLAFAEIPRVLVAAVVAAEDRRFYEHRGVDVRGVVRAAVANAESGETTQGGSTITQQLVKNTLVTPERTYQRKVREAALAMGLERTLTKDQILERYLNTVYFGEGAYGVGAAARVYFGHAATTLSLPEAALLAGLIRSPTRADPVRAPKAAVARRAQVLAAMMETGAITRTEAAEAGAAPVPRVARRDDRRYPAAYAVQDAVSTLLADKRLGATPEARRNALFRGGLRIDLTIDPAQQAAAEESVRSLLGATNDPYAGVAAVKPGDGAITAMVGGRDFFGTRDPYAKVNLARGGTTKRQAGSTFKVFALVAALQKGVKPEDTFEAGAQATLPCHCPKPWVVDNYEGTAFGRITLRQATESSVNTAYAHVVQRIGDGDVDRGTSEVLNVAEELGVHGAGGKPLRRGSGPAVVLGAQEVDPVEMAAAYAALGANGVYARPYLVASVRDARGKVLLRNTPRRHQAVPAGVAALANDVLQGVVRSGTGVKAAQPRPVAGKTGTSTGYADAWFVGYTPNFAAAVWVGEPRGEISMTPENGYRTVIAGGTFPAMIWGRFAGTALLRLPNAPFVTPEGAAVSVALDRHHGCVANRWTPEAWIERRTFSGGSEPKNVCADPTGPPAEVVPTLLGSALDYAQRELAHAGLLVKTVEVYDLRYPAGAVVGQQPAAGAPVAPGGTVTLSVATQEAVPVAVPSVLGLDEVDAVRRIEAAGLKAEVVVEPSCTGGAACQARLAADAGKVWRQDVAGGAKRLAGSTVTVAVGPRQG